MLLFVSGAMPGPVEKLHGRNVDKNPGFDTFAHLAEWTITTNVIITITLTITIIITIITNSINISIFTIISIMNITTIGDSMNFYLT